MMTIAHYVNNSEYSVGPSLILIICLKLLFIVYTNFPLNICPRQISKYLVAYIYIFVVVVFHYSILMKFQNILYNVHIKIVYDWRSNTCTSHCKYIKYVCKHVHTFIANS